MSIFEWVNKSMRSDFNEMFYVCIGVFSYTVKAGNSERFQF